MTTGTVIELCAGYGGLFMGLSAAVPGLRLTHVAEIDGLDEDGTVKGGAAAILAHHHPDVPNLGDLKEIDWAALSDPSPEWLLAGYPCQPFSAAGLKRGADDPRHLWPWIVPGVAALRPRYVLFENVQGHVKRGLPEVLADLVALGYAVAWAVVRASDVGAPHKRARVFILGMDALAAGVAPVAFEVPRVAHPPTLSALGALLPTPEAKLAASGPDYARMNRPNSGGHDLTTAVHLLPPDDWGKYAAAVKRWESVTGVAAPDPIVPGAREGERLNPELPEWMMGLGAGYITAVPGLASGAAVKAAGNGVCPPQAARAVAILLSALNAYRDTVLDVHSTPQVERDTMSIPREDLYAVVTAANFVTEPAGQHCAVSVLKAAAESFASRAQAVIDARRKGWKGESERLAMVGNEIAAFALVLASLDLPATPDDMTVTDADRDEAAAEAYPAATDAKPEPCPCGPEQYCHRDDCSGGATTSMDAHQARTAAAELFPGQCTSSSAGERCSLPGAPPHTGTHIGVRGGKWPQVVVAADPTPTGDDAVIVATVPQQRTAKQIVAAGDGYEIVNNGAVAVLERPATVCVACDTDTHTCQGCGENTAHDGSHACTHPEGTHYVPPTPLEIPTMTGDPAADFAAAFGLNVISAGPVLHPAHPAQEFTIVGSAPPPAWSGPDLMPFDIWTPASGQPKAYQSPSSIESYAGCGLKYRFTYREGLPGRPLWAGVGGTALHETIETIEKAWFAGTSFDPTAPSQQYEAAASELFKAAFRKAIDLESASSGPYADPGTWYAAKQGSENEAWWWDKGETMARLYLTTRRDWHDKGWRLLGDPQGNPVTELPFATLLGSAGPNMPEVVLQGRIDDVWVNEKTGALHIRDPKSKDRKPESAFQLQAYGVALRDLMGLAAAGRTITASYLMLRKGEHTTPVTLTDDDRKVVNYRAMATDAADRAGVFVPNPSSFCVACPFRKQCPAAA